MPDKKILSQRWSAGVCLGVLALFYFPVFKELYTSRWGIIDYTHAYFVLPVVIWLIWRKRGEYKEQLSQGSTWGLLLIGTALFLFVIGWRNDYLSVAVFSLIPMLFGFVLYLYGRRLARKLAFPVLYLLLLVPPPLGILDRITLPMRYGVTAAADIFMRSFHFPVQRSGLLLYVGGSEIYMGQPCSGMRSLIALTALGLLLAYISRLNGTNRVILAASILPLALLGNFMRIAGMCIVTYYLGSHSGEVFHDYAGYGVFFLLILGLTGLEALLGRGQEFEEDEY